MGVCESSKEKSKNITQNKPVLEINNNKLQKAIVNDDDYLNRLETHTSSNSQENEIKHPELARYSQDNCKNSEISNPNNSKVISAFSSQNEEEVIIKNEVNKQLINKDGDFDNIDLKNLVKKNGGIVIKDNDNMSNVLSYQGLNPAFDIGKINKQAEIKSMRTLPAKLSKIREQNLIQNGNDKLRLSNKINVSFHDNIPANDALINIPKQDEPLPDIDELSTESPILILRNSIESE